MSKHKYEYHVVVCRGKCSILGSWNSDLHSINAVEEMLVYICKQQQSPRICLAFSTLIHYLTHPYVYRCINLKQIMSPTHKLEKGKDSLLSFTLKASKKPPIEYNNES